MNTQELQKMEADANLFNLGGNPYPGRGIVIGMDMTGLYLVQIYWIMGRSFNSRNRIFRLDERVGRNGLLFTEVADPSKVEDPSLIIYNAMDELRSCYVVSNGAHTDDIIQAVRHNLDGKSLHEALRGRQYEPDAPNWTPRIAAICMTDGCKPVAEMAILRKSPQSGACERFFYQFEELFAGFGHCITTYSGDGDHLLSFRGEPLLVPLFGGIDTIADTYWETLNVENRVSLAVKFIPKDGKSKTVTVIRNKYEQMQAA